VQSSYIPRALGTSNTSDRIFDHGGSDCFGFKEAVGTIDAAKGLKLVLCSKGLRNRFMIA
jgi:hypothetical protein